MKKLPPHEFKQDRSHLGPLAQALGEVFDDFQKQYDTIARGIEADLCRKLFGEPPPPPPPLTMKDIDELLIRFGLKEPPPPGSFYGIEIRRPKPLIDTSNCV